MRDRRLPVWLRPLAMVPAAYMASPIDVLPDFIPSSAGSTIVSSLRRHSGSSAASRLSPCSESIFSPFRRDDGPDCL